MTFFAYIKSIFTDYDSGIKPIPPLSYARRSTTSQSGETRQVNDLVPLSTIEEGILNCLIKESLKWEVLYVNTYTNHIQTDLFYRGRNIGLRHRKWTDLESAGRSDCMEAQTELFLHSKVVAAAEDIIANQKENEESKKVLELVAKLKKCPSTI